MYIPKRVLESDAAGEIAAAWAARERDETSGHMFRGYDTTNPYDLFSMSPRDIAAWEERFL